MRRRIQSWLQRGDERIDPHEIRPRIGPEHELELEEFDWFNLGPVEALSHPVIDGHVWEIIQFNGGAELRQKLLHGPQELPYGSLDYF